MVKKEYLRFEHPKKLVREKTENGEKKYRDYDKTKPKGYNIVTGKLSFEINKILDPNDIAPTLVATDVSRLAVPDNGGLRKLTIREGLRLFGYPEWYEISVKETEAFDLLGNTVAVPVVEHVAKQLAEIYQTHISTMQPKIMVRGDPSYLRSNDHAMLIRSLLFAGIRAAILWRQCGGKKRHLLFSRRNVAATAKALLDSLNDI